MSFTYGRTASGRSTKRASAPPPALVIFEDLAEIVDALKATGGETKTEGAAGLTALRLLAGQFLFSGANLAPHEVSAARRPGRPLDIIKRPADPSTA